MNNQALLQVVDISVQYGPIEVLRNINFQIQQGEFISVIGTNGAGKTTLLKALSGILPAQKGEIFWESQKINNIPAHLIARRGIAHCPEGRHVFMSMTVKDNLQMGGYNVLRAKKKSQYKELIGQAFELFPRLKEKETHLAGNLSGGEQQMLAIARALMMPPRLLMLDEPTLGLAPKLIDELMLAITKLRKFPGLSVLLVEQMASRAMKITDRTLIFERGNLILSGNSQDLLSHPSVKKSYLG